MTIALIGPEMFRAAMRRLPGGCSIVTVPTTAGPAGRLISAVTALSAEPPSILISLMRSAAITDEILGAKRCSLAILSVANLRTAAAFSHAPSLPMAERFAAGGWSHDDGRLKLENAAANLWCAVETTFEVGTHTILVAQILAAECGQAEPLVYAQAQFGRHQALA